MLIKFVFYFLDVFVGTAGEMCMSRAMKSMGEVTDFPPEWDRPHCRRRDESSVVLGLVCR